MNLSKLICTFSIFGSCLYSLPSIAEPTKPLPLATTTLEAKIYLVLDEPNFETNAQAVWLFTMASNSFIFSPTILEDNLAANAEKFCGGGVWKPIHKKLESGYLEAAFSCLDEKARPYKKAAIAQDLPTITPSSFLR